MKKQVVRRMAKAAALLGRDLQERPVCRHHWVIDSPAAPISKDVCRLSWEERDFRNYLENSSWGVEVSLDRLAGSSRLPAGVDIARPLEGLQFEEELQ